MQITLYCQQIKSGTHFDSGSPDFSSYAEMVDIPNLFPTFHKSPVFEEFFSTPFVGRYVVISKNVGNKTIEEKVLEFKEVMVWLE